MAPVMPVSASAAAAAPKRTSRVASPTPRKATAEETATASSSGVGVVAEEKTIKTSNVDSAGAAGTAEAPMGAGCFGGLKAFVASWSTRRSAVVPTSATDPANATVTMKAPMGMRYLRGIKDFVASWSTRRTAGAVMVAIACAAMCAAHSMGAFDTFAIAAVEAVPVHQKTVAFVGCSVIFIAGTLFAAKTYVPDFLARCRHTLKKAVALVAESSLVEQFSCRRVRLLALLLVLTGLTVFAVAVYPADGWRGVETSLRSSAEVIIERASGASQSVGFWSFGAAGALVAVTMIMLVKTILRKSSA
eukprot:TRINITY_DN14946_c0_g1_i1.p1 TRINITY_DN14946_c0_g1~~TRINITY_DN14946_c0_g1_i1.p1  ORF type:complete len:304 (+),score=44.23 TRINITY_DN14946_c0_g1_i1:73-984(+)